MLKRFSVALMCLFVFMIGFSGMVGAEFEGYKAELTGKEWTTSTTVNTGIPSGGARLNYQVNNDGSSGQQLLYTISFRDNNGQVVPFTAGILNPGENKADRIFIHQPGRYTLTLTALRYGLPNSYSPEPNCKATGELNVKFLGCFPRPGDLD